MTGEEHKKLQDGHQLLADLLVPDLQDESAAAILGEGKPDEAPTKKKRKPPKKGHGRTKRDAFKNAKVVKVSHDELKAGQPCACGCGKLYPLNRVAHFRHFVGQAPIEVTLYELEQLRCNGCEKVFTADLPEGVGPEPYDATAVSTIALNKYGMGLPFHRQAGLLGALGVPISASVQYQVVAEALPKLLPVHGCLEELAAQGKVSYFDDTSMKILDFTRDKDDKRTGIFTTGIVSVHDSFEIALFFTGRNHAGENRAELLDKREPSLPAMIQMSDALSSNLVGVDTKEDVIAFCLAHGRRNFVKVIESFPEECRLVIEAIGTIYHHDKLSKELEHSDEQRLAYHQEHSEPVMNRLKDWLDEQFQAKRVEPNSNLGKAIQYLRKHWTGLTLFLRVPGAPLDNNAAERVLKRAVLHRKNSLFYRTAKGAKTGDVYMSLIQTCQRNGINPFDYLTAVQRHHQAAKANPGEWLPWNFQEALDRTRGSPP